MYKPIQIAEILHYHRVKQPIDFNDINSYRNISKKWRDKISMQLVGNISTSSQKFQDNLFDANAIPPNILLDLANLNTKGEIESFVYFSLKNRLELVHNAVEYCQESGENFNFLEFLNLFAKNQELKRSIDKIYEILVFSLFNAIIEILEFEITCEIKNNDTKIINDFSFFTKNIMGFNEQCNKINFAPRIFRIGIANAADSGIDILSNFGSMIQVKHINLNNENIEEISHNIESDTMIIICKDIDKKYIDIILKQVGIGKKIKSIITTSDLEKLYKKSFEKQYYKKLASKIIEKIIAELQLEFPSAKNIADFINIRNYKLQVYSQL